MERDQAFLLDILQSARMALSYLHGLDREEFLADTMRQDSVLRRLEIIGEAARRVSAQTRSSHPGIPWKEMVSMRNLVIHDYDDVDLDIVWDTIHRDLPYLIREIEPLVPPEGE
jgi:uncharacterized protein with HEPN domain